MPSCVVFLLHKYQYVLLGSTFASVSKTRALIVPPLCWSSFWGVDEKLLRNYFLGLSWGSSDHCCIMTWGVVIIVLYFGPSKENAYI